MPHDDAPIPTPAGDGGPDHFRLAATRLGAPPTFSASWEGVHTQHFQLPPGGWSHPEATFLRITIPLAQPQRVRRRLAGNRSGWVGAEKRPGTITLTPPHTAGEWQWFGDSTFALLFLPETLLRDALLESGRVEQLVRVRPAFAEPDDVIDAVYRMMVAEQRQRGRESRLLVSSAAVFLAHHILHRYGSQTVDLDRKSSPLDDRRLARVVDAVDADLAHDWSVHEMALVAGLSACWFAHAFKSKVGASPRAFVQARRLACAKRMLERPGVPVASIAAHCGFESQSWFTTCFRQAFGITPAAYRRSMT